MWVQLCFICAKILYASKRASSLAISSWSLMSSISRAAALSGAYLCEKEVATEKRGDVGEREPLQSEQWLLAEAGGGS